MIAGMDRNGMGTLFNLPERQQGIINALINEFQNKNKSTDGLTARQQDILNLLLQEFNRS